MNFLSAQLAADRAEDAGAAGFIWSLMRTAAFSSKRM